MVRANNIIALVVFLIIVCAVLAVYLLYQNNVDVVKKTRYYPGKTIIFDNNSFQEDRLVYLLCEPSNLSQCRLVQEKYPFKDIYRSCSVKLEVEGKTSPDTIFVVAMGFDRTILVWEDDKQKPGGPFARFKIVDLADCKDKNYQFKEYQRIDVRNFRNATKIVPYISQFEVFYKNQNECGLTECELYLDKDGEIVIPGKSQANVTINNIDSEVKYIFPVKNYAPDKGLVYVKYRNFIESSDFYYSQFRKNVESAPVLILPGKAKISVVDETIGVCSRGIENSKLSTNVTCYQLYVNASDWTTHFKLNVTVENVNNITHLHNVYSIPEGGFLLSFIDFGRCQEDICDENLLSNYFILRIDEEGNQVGKLRFQGLEKECKGLEHAHIYKQQKKGDEEYCAFIVPEQKQDDKFDILANCFPLSNFVS